MSLRSPQFQERVEVWIFACNKINQSPSLIYIHDYNIPDIEDYGSELKKEYNLLDVQKSTWIKTKIITSTPLILTFKDRDKYASTEVRCCHCGEDHKAFSRSCSIFKRETDVVQIQTNERIPRLQAIQKLLRLNSNSELIFTSNRTTSKSPTTSELESHQSIVKTTHRLYHPTATDTILKEKVRRKVAHPPHR